MERYSGTVLLKLNKYDYTIYEDRSILVYRHGCEYCFSSSMIDAKIEYGNNFINKYEFENFLEEYKKVLEIARKYIFLC